MHLEKAREPQVQQAEYHQPGEHGTAYMPSAHGAHGVVQAMIGEATGVQTATDTPNNTGLPDTMKSNLETMSGFDMSDVRVHYNSSKPASIGALAYTRGSQIYMGPGQNKHLGHEAWHVVQQKQGRVKGNTQFKGMSGNNNAGLEREADRMGSKALNARIPASVSDPIKQVNPLSIVQCRSFTNDELSSIKGVKFVSGGGQLANGKNADLLVNDTKPLQAQDITEALKTAAERYALVAKQAHKIKEEANLNNISAETDDRNNGALNPFVFLVEVKYGTGSEMETLKLFYQFSNQTPGYVIQQKAGSEESAYLTHHQALNVDGSEGEQVDYDYTHHNTGDIPLRELLVQSALKSQKENRSVLDARTKIAGEGARFRVVRDNAARIADNSKLYFLDNSAELALDAVSGLVGLSGADLDYIEGANLFGSSVYWISFSTLWKKWQSWFDSDYDITNQTIIEKIKENLMTDDVEEESGSNFKPSAIDIRLDSN